MRTATLAAIAAAALLAGATGEAAAVVRVRSFLEPGVVRLGEPARYRGEILFTRGELSRPQWIRPDSTGAFAWGPMITSLSRGVGARGVDTLRLLTTVQAFELGSVAVPGVAFVDAATAVPSPQRLPGATLRVVSILTPADSNAQLRPVRGPIAAPWWERVPWLFVVLGLIAVAVVIALVRRMRRKEQRPALAPVAPRVVHDPAALARARLAKLRARHLPEDGAFGEHALELTAILRRYLEAAVTAGPQGDTTSELSERLQGTALRTTDVAEIAELLQRWDRVKFARVVPTVQEAHRHERDVEAFIERHSGPVAKKEAA